MSLLLQWEGEVNPHHRQIIQMANDAEFLSQALCRVYPACQTIPQSATAIVSPLATGGAMVVYKITVAFPHQPSHHLVGKIPRQRRIVYAAGTEHQTDHDTTHALLQRLLSLADHLGQHAPGLFPRCGGVWHRQRPDGNRQHVLIEEFIAGVSVERLKHRYEDQLLAGQLSETQYQQQLTTVERLAIAAYIHLWDALQRQTFTSDPSPWNVLIRHADSATPQATIIDLHSLEENTDLTYVIQRMAAVYGNRQEIVEGVIIAGIFDALGAEEGRLMLREALPRLEAHSEQTRQNLGVNLQRPLLQAIRKLC